jgi:chromosome segregation ATPase
MSMTQDEIDAHNADIQTRINANQASMDTANSSLKTVSGQIQRLQTAIKSAQSIISQYRDFAGKIESDYRSLVSSNFKGSLKDKISKSFKAKSTALNSEIKSHQSNLTILQNKLKSLQSKQTSLTGTIKSLSDMISSLSNQFY